WARPHPTRTSKAAKRAQGARCGSRSPPPALDPMTELAVDLVRAIRSRDGVGLAEMLRLRRDVTRGPERAYLRRYAPSLLDAFEKVDDEPIELESHVRRSATALDEARDAALEAELEEEAAALIESEAEADDVPPRRRIAHRSSS
ncbi:MAG TPA: hypothetical protein VL400_08450, partial [Polyangiaceae bacterium]|nr:hypothetical protein [Polyangiaceae bacterium]